MDAVYNILIATDLTEDSLNFLRSQPDVQVLSAPPKVEALREKLTAASALIARDDLLIDEALMDAAPSLKIIGRMGAGMGGIDIEGATRRGIIVTNTPGTSAIAAGEHAMALMLALSRRLVTVHNSLKLGWWLLDRKQHAGTQLKGKTLGIVGLGRVGRVVAQRALAFGMTVIASDPYIAEGLIDDERIQLVGLRELLRRSDIVTLHVPPTAETRGMFDASLIRQMKPGARLINTSFGAVLDEAAVAEAIRDGHLAGAAVDVYREEPPYNSPLIGMDEVIHTPHVAENTLEAAQDLSLQIVNQVLDALRGVDFRNALNLPFMPGVEFEHVRPYMILAERIGHLLHLLSRTPVRRIAVEYRGEEIVTMVKPLTVALLKGLLAPSLGERVSYINAPVLASERGLQITQAKGIKTGDYINIVSAQVTLDDGEEITVSGTLLDRQEPHIVQINEYRMNFVPHGHLLIMGSYDRPGVIGTVGTLLSNHDINIASWQTGRAERGGQTLTVLTLDQPLPDAVLEELLKLEFVRHVHQVALLD
ncbi:MAG TPA: phosphoglycerate dehydrogenase [Aggregatilineales bacterium]|mgnify:CR=1 FL=1|jgi:D-3-phosphoglycerate dehydrogenase|nr:phosphoglycerate dehydrogenase [Aggregatilineales bacterium]